MITYDEYCETINPLCQDCALRASDQVLDDVLVCQDCANVRREALIKESLPSETASRRGAAP